MTPFSFNSLHLCDDKSFIFNFCRKESVKADEKDFKTNIVQVKNCLTFFLLLCIPVNLLIILNDN